MTVTFRHICSDDEAFLSQVYASTRLDELAVTDWTDEQKAAFLQMQFAAQHKFYQENYTDTDFLVVLQDDTPIGRLYVARWKDEIRIVDIALLPAYRGTGIGATILRDLFVEADAAGKPVRIHVERENPALRLYQRLGFVMIEDKGVYLFMERRVTGDG
ncbi:MAG: N-acetyltransferase [Deltaproteobacteria bacterium]|nr:N-acetyltransferase [Deltaproteobacteria bacterium]